jgi:hypothetical protein
METANRLSAQPRSLSDGGHGVNDDNLPAFWSLSFRFLDWNAAGTGYERCRDLIFGRDIDASAYRILLNGEGYVVIVGAGVPEKSLIQELHELCQSGESSDIPDEVMLTLAMRHEQFRSVPGTKCERRAQL